MRTFLHFITLCFFTNTGLAQTGLVLPGTGTDRQLQKNVQTLRGADHLQPLFIANGAIIGGNEIKIKLVDTIYVFKGAESYEKYGGIGANGVVCIGTRQAFDTISISNLADDWYFKNENRRTVYAVNGYLFADPNLSISRKAIRRVNVFKRYRLDASDEIVTCISIWTISKKQIRKDSKMPKLCRGVR
jgi:hypothetical protein